MDPQTHMGPLVYKEQLDRVCGFLESGAKEGARATAVRKDRLEGKAYFVNPPFWWTRKPDMKVVKEEIFGPVVTAIPFDGH